MLLAGGAGGVEVAGCSGAAGGEAGLGRPGTDRHREHSRWSLSGHGWS